MSRTLDVYLKTSEPPARVEQRFRAQLTSRGAETDHFAIEFHASSPDDRAECRARFGFEPDVSASIGLPRGVGDADPDAAALIASHESGAELLVVYQGEPLLAYRAGTAYPAADSRTFFEEDVLPGFDGRVNWNGPPWRPETG